MIRLNELNYYFIKYEQTEDTKKGKNLTKLRAYKKKKQTNKKQTNTWDSIKGTVSGGILTSIFLL